MQCILIYRYKHELQSINSGQYFYAIIYLLISCLTLNCDISFRSAIAVVIFFSIAMLLLCSRAKFKYSIVLRSTFNIIPYPWVSISHSFFGNGLFSTIDNQKNIISVLNSFCKSRVK